MFTIIYRDPRFDKCLEALRTSGKKGAVVADRAEDIIGRIQSQGYIRPDQLGLCLRLPDARLPNCIKYYLGNGFRMVTVEENNEMYLLHIGAHDDCQKWVENNKNLQLEPVRLRSRPCRVKKRQSKAAKGDAAISECEVVQEDDPLCGLDDRLLREVFAGLCGAS